MDPITSDDKDHATQTVNTIFLYHGQGQQRRPPSKFKAHKAAHHQLGSQVSLPFPPSIPCMAGRLKNYVQKWHTTTSDQWILDTITGVTIDFTAKPTQLFVPNQDKFNPLEIKINIRILCELRTYDILWKYLRFTTAMITSSLH